MPVSRVGDECKGRVTIWRVESFKAILGGEEGERPTVELPFDGKERFGRARAPVRGTVNGTDFRTTLAVYGGVYLIGFNKELRERAGIAIGDEVEVTLELDDEPRTVELPPALKEALEQDAEAKAAYEGLSYTHRCEYAQWIAEAKRDATRERRVTRAVKLLRDGVRTPG
jgi:bifunctional DNA-binding transcriptional regulator/antitoxin component of YhaV-PrlF toxin-antitoxin module